MTHLEEQLLPIDPVGGDCLLTFGQDKPIHESAALHHLHAWALRRIDQHDAVLIEQAPVAPDDDLQVSPILEAQPSPSVGESVRAQSGSRVERLVHARPYALILGPRRGGDIDAGLLPQSFFGFVCAAIIAARDKGALAAAIRRNAATISLPTAICAGSLLGPDEHEIVVHDVVTIDAVARRAKLEFRGHIVDEDDVCIAALADLECLAGADGDNAHFDSGVRGESRQQMAKEADCSVGIVEATVM